jgi:phosphoribosylformylglycinamidine (FGAM) synthase PurS component
MSKRAVAISLKIPDNTAYTAVVALRRLGIGVERVERSEIWLFDDGRDVRALIERITADETIFNPNKHRVTVLDEAAPRSGEVWIEPLEGGVATAWRLLGRDDAVLDKATLRAAAERLLCNPAIERAIY